MTLKDYVNIAAAVKLAHRHLDATQARVVAVVADHIADALAADNPRFDRAKFLAACKPDRPNDPDGEKEHALDQQYHTGKITYAEYEQRRAAFSSAAEQDNIH